MGRRVVARGRTLCHSLVSPVDVPVAALSSVSRETVSVRVVLGTVLTTAVTTSEDSASPSRLKASPSSTIVQRAAVLASGRVGLCQA